MWQLWLEDINGKVFPCLQLWSKSLRQSFLSEPIKYEDVMEVLPFLIGNNCHHRLAIYWVISGVTYHSHESDYQKCCAKIVDFCNNMLDCDTKFGIKFHHVISKTDVYLYDALNGKIFNNIPSPFTVEESASAIIVQWSADRYMNTWERYGSTILMEMSFQPIACDHSILGMFFGRHPWLQRKFLRYCLSWLAMVVICALHCTGYCQHYVEAAYLLSQVW